MKKVLLVVLLVVGLSACASKVEFSNSRSVVIQYSASLESSTSVLAKAQATCNLYNRDAVLNKEQRSAWGGLRSAHYNCVDR